MSVPFTVTDDMLKNIMGRELFSQWQEAVSLVERLYDMEKVWHQGGKAAQYELKFRRGGKTLVSFFPKEDAVGVMLIFGKAEREKFEGRMDGFCDYVMAEYGKAPTYHDGKWVMFHLPNEDFMRDLPDLLLLKRKPNKK